MKRFLSFKVVIFLVIFSFLLPGISKAMTLNVSPNPADKGQPVRFDITTLFQAPPPIFTHAPLPTSCEILIDYGDGNSAVAGVCQSLNCNLSVIHTYNNPGRYLAVARVNQKRCNRQPAGSSISRKVVVVRCSQLVFLSPSTLPQAKVGEPYSYRLAVKGGEPAISYAVVGGSLPSGLHLSRDGLISGTPSSSGRYSFTARAADSCPLGSQRVERTFTIDVAFIPAPVRPASLNLNINPNPADVGQAVTNNIFVNFPAQVGTAAAPPSVNCEVLIDYGDGSRGVAGVCRSDSCNISINHQYVNPGSYLVSALVNPKRCNRPTGASSSDQERLTVRCRPLNFSPVSLPKVQKGKSYSYRLSATGGEPGISYSLAGGRLPAGLNLSSAGTISGIPSSAGTYTFTVRATDSCPLGPQQVERRFTMVVEELPPPPPGTSGGTEKCPRLSITTGTHLPDGQVNSAYSQRISYSGGRLPVRFSLAGGRLPPGIVLSQDGMLSGLPKQARIFHFSVSTIDSCPSGPQKDVRTFTLTIKQAPGAETKRRNLYVSVSPKSVTIPRGLPSALHLRYSFSGNSEINTILNSSQGVFRAKGQDIGANGHALRVHVQGGRALVNEEVPVPVAVLKRAERLGTTRFSYVRSFSNAEFSLEATVFIVITTEAASPFRISRIQLYFDNKRAETTVERGGNPPGLFAEIRYLGTGLLKGYWEVDGRPLADVFKHITYGRSITLKLPVTAVLPTFEPGVHRVRFVITEPFFDAEFPEAIYYVTSQSYKVKRIRLLRPSKKSKLSLAALDFKWQGLDNSTFAYLIEFREKKDGKPLFSAYVKSDHYTVPVKIAVRYFGPAKDIYWQVKGFSQEGELIGESPVWKFTLEKEASYVPGQVVLVWARDGKEDLVKRLERRLGIRLLYKFELSAINKVYGVFSTNGQKVTKVIKKARKLSDVRYAGPNYIFQLFEDPLVNRQVIFDILDLSKIKGLQNRKTKVAVIDTGVDATHPDLKSAVIEKKNFIHDETYVPEIHGTAVAGILGARQNGVGIQGIAPKAQIVALRACRQVKKGDPRGQCFSDSITRALNYAIEHGARVVNMSLGAYVEDGAIKELILQGKKRGVLFVAPVGNRPGLEALPFPASLEEVLAVGGITEDGRMFPDKKVCAKADVLVPCQNIFTTVPGGRYNFLNGTSMASAIAAGILALDVGPPPGSFPKPVKFCHWLNSVIGTGVCKGKKE